jgi:hypothetical protein
MISIVDHVQGNVKRRAAEVLQRDDAAWRGFVVVKERGEIMCRGFLVVKERGEII